MSICCQGPDKVTDLELCAIEAHLPNGKVFSGTIQDFQCIEAIVSNARRNLMDFAEMSFTDKEDEADVLDSVKELDCLLSMFK